MSTRDHDCSREAFRVAVAGMSHHLQGHHGWSVFYQGLDQLVSSDDEVITRLVGAAREARPELSDAHLATLVALTVRAIVHRERTGEQVFDERVAVARRAALLRDTLTGFEQEIAGALATRSNSFTGARRFLVPQVLIGHFARRHRIPDVRLLDLGTSVGLLPRQLNHRGMFDRFAADLTWRPAELGYLEIPLACRHGVDRPPLPRLDWVRACHGPSSYYGERYREVLQVLDEVAAIGVEVRVDELDLLDSDRLAEHVRGRAYNAVVCGFVLYQYQVDVRRRIMCGVAGALPTPGLLVSIEPGSELADPGCRVEVYVNGSDRPLHVLDVSDSHFVGTVTPGGDYAEFLAAHTVAGT